MLYQKTRRNPGCPSVDILVRSWQWYSFCHGKILSREPCSQENFYCKILFDQKTSEKKSTKTTSMQIYKRRHDNFLLAGYKIWLKCPYAVYLVSHWLNCSINCKTVATNGVRKAPSWIITQTEAMNAASNKNKPVETGLQKAEDMNLQKSPDT